jgi:hypothetical protein
MLRVVEVLLFCCLPCGSSISVKVIWIHMTTKRDNVRNNTTAFQVTSIILQFLIILLLDLKFNDQDI